MIAAVAAVAIVICVFISVVLPVIFYIRLVLHYCIS